MPKVSSLGIPWRGGFKGSHIPISELIAHRVVVDITDFSVRPSCMHGSQMCMTQLRIAGRPMVTWHGSQNLIAFLEECKRREGQGEVCFPIEDCIFTQGDDGGYYLSDADDTCLHVSAEELEDMAGHGRRRGRMMARGRRIS